MLKILAEKWNQNKDALREAIKSKPEFMYHCRYKDLVRLTFEVIYNTGEESFCNQLDIDNITEIDDGDYQGTLLFLVPFDNYQPSESDYLMTFINYGSCSGCDTLLHLQSWMVPTTITDKEIDSFVILCKGIIVNTIKPYNYGWRHNEKFDVVEDVI